MAKKQNANWKEGKVKGNENSKENPRKAKPNNGRPNRRNSGDCSTNKNNNILRDSSIGGNDLSWYNKYGTLLENAGVTSFYNPLGAEFEVFGSDTPYVPGVMGIGFTPTIGETNDINSPINRAARRLFDEIAIKNNRNFSYNSPDIMQYFLGYDSCIALHAFARRIYGILNTYSNVNRYVPDGILKAMRVDPESFRENLAEFKYRINRMALDMSALACPEGATYTARHVFLNSNVYTDSPVGKGQMYVPYLSSYYKYAGAVVDGSNRALNGVCYLKPLLPDLHDPDHQLLTYSELITFMDELVYALLSNQDINNISADILKATEGRVWKWDMMEDNYTVLPVFNTEILDQIQNTTVFGSAVYPTVSETVVDGITTTRIDPFASGVIWQNPALNYNLDGHIDVISRIGDTDDQFVTYLPEEASTMFDKGVLLNTFLENPNAGSVALMTRNVYTITRNSSDTSINKVALCGSEVATHIDIVINNGSSNSTPWDMTSFLLYVKFRDQDLVDYRNIWFKLFMLSKFDYHPRLYLTYVSVPSGDGPTIREYSEISDWTNYTSISTEQLRRIHDVCLQSMFSFTV